MRRHQPQRDHSRPLRRRIYMARAARAWFQGMFAAPSQVMRAAPSQDTVLRPTKFEREVIPPMPFSVGNSNCP